MDELFDLDDPDHWGSQYLDLSLVFLESLGLRRIWIHPLKTKLDPGP